MSANTPESPGLYTIEKEMNAHGAVTVRSTATNATYHLVEYADESTRESLSSLASGESVRIHLSRVGARGNVWRAEGAPRAESSVSPAGSAAGS
ncbi:hypothetical protein [Halobellus ordinarius]|uniref:hypothetical protein n=1 Tax=Halobellus ordinarius TaxID=3075120 RepID=UPI0028805455|nr:hypothetical protein [Halobellus sp. ZY16]